MLGHRQLHRFYEREHGKRDGSGSSGTGRNDERLPKGECEAREEVWCATQEPQCKQHAGPPQKHCVPLDGQERREAASALKNC